MITALKIAINLVWGMFPRTKFDPGACCLFRDVGDWEVPA